MIYYDVRMWKVAITSTRGHFVAEVGIRNTWEVGRWPSKLVGDGRLTPLSHPIMSESLKFHANILKILLRAYHNAYRTSHQHFPLTVYTRVCVYSSKCVKPNRMYTLLKAYSSFL